MFALTWGEGPAGRGEPSEPRRETIRAATEPSPDIVAPRVCLMASAWTLSFSCAAVPAGSGRRGIALVASETARGAAPSAGADRSDGLAAPRGGPGDASRTNVRMMSRHAEWPDWIALRAGAGSTRLSATLCSGTRVRTEGEFLGQSFKDARAALQGKAGSTSMPRERAGRRRPAATALKPHANGEVEDGA